MDFRGGSNFCNDTFHITKSNQFKGGTTFIVSIKRVALMFIPSRVQHITIMLSPSMKIGIRNVYTPNYTIGWVRLWHTLANLSLPKDHQVVGGGYNNVELGKYQSQGYFGCTMGRRECNNWNAFLMSLGLMDSQNLEEFKWLGNKNFTWCKKFPTPIWSCLDRFYVDVSIQQQGGGLGYGLQWHTSLTILQIFYTFV